MKLNTLLSRSLLILSIVFIVSAFKPVSDDKSKVEKLLDNWHLAASNADYEGFFGRMHKDAIYLGTQADERWTKPEFIKFAKPYFDRGKAWSFEPFDRTVYPDETGSLMWFEESLKTWMGVCRGSGVVVKTKDEWEIIHYNLCVTISNDLVNDFIDVIKNDTINNFLLEPQ